MSQEIWDLKEFQGILVFEPVFNLIDKFQTSFLCFWLFGLNSPLRKCLYHNMKQKQKCVPDLICIPKAL